MEALRSVAGEQFAAQPAQDEADLQALVKNLAESPSAGRVDELVAKMGAARPSPDLATFISDTLNSTALHEVRDSEGITFRWRLVDRLLDLGFPHALCVTPDDLEYHRERSGGTRVSAVFTVISGIISALWNGGWLLLLLAAMRSDFSLPLAAIGACLVTALIHGCAAVVFGGAAMKGDPAPGLRTLGRMFFIGPAAIAVTAIGAPEKDVWLLALLVAFPAMLTAALAALASRKRSG